MDRDDVELADFAWASGGAGLDEPLTGGSKAQKRISVSFWPGPIAVRVVTGT